MFDRNTVNMNCMVADINTQWKAALDCRRLQYISHDDVCIINFSRDAYSIYTTSPCVLNKLKDFLNSSGLDFTYTNHELTPSQPMIVTFASSQVEKLRPKKVEAFIRELYENLTTQPADEEMGKFVEFQLYLKSIQPFNDLKKRLETDQSQANVNQVKPAYQ